jgi:hypothetical protein
LEIFVLNIPGVKMQEGEKIAGGMSYRTMNGNAVKHLMEYLEGSDENSSKEILEKNKDYYIASANKTIARLKLAKKRVLYAQIEENYAETIYDKISTSIKWLNELKDKITSVTNRSELLEPNQYKKWHAVKLIPSAAEGIAISLLISREIDYISDKGESSNKELLESARTHNKKSKSNFIKLLNLSDQSNFKEAERLRIEGYSEAAHAVKKIKY